MGLAMIEANVGLALRVGVRGLQSAAGTEAFPRGGGFAECPERRSARQCKAVSVGNYLKGA